MWLAANRGIVALRLVVTSVEVSLCYRCRQQTPSGLLPIGRSHFMAGLAHDRTQPPSHLPSHLPSVALTLPPGGPHRGGGAAAREGEAAARNCPPARGPGYTHVGANTSTATRSAARV